MGRYAEAATSWAIAYTQLGQARTEREIYDANNRLQDAFNNLGNNQDRILDEADQTAHYILESLDTTIREIQTHSRLIQNLTNNSPYTRHLRERGSTLHGRQILQRLNTFGFGPNYTSSQITQRASQNQTSSVEHSFDITNIHTNRVLKVWFCGPNKFRLYREDSSPWHEYFNITEGGRLTSEGERSPYEIIVDAITRELNNPS